ncbi:MAG: TolC family protein [Rubrivivax sp.]|nr:MAG: TolC family protein [Rubrivivax sp.]
MKPRLVPVVAQALRCLALTGMALSLGACTVIPTPIDVNQSAPQAKQRLDTLIADEEPLHGTVTLYEAMARALKYNLDHKIELMDEQLKQKQLELRSFDMLPSLVASSGYNSRSNDAGARSRSLLSGNQSLEPSTSSERRSTTADLGLSWDVLDFGLAYVRAHQQADERMIATEKRRKVVNRILEDVRTAYWRAVSADRTFKKLVDLEGLAQRSLRQAEEMEARRIVAPLTVLGYQRDLLQVQGDVQRLQRELAQAKSQLAALMNLRPNADFKLMLPDRTDIMPELPGSADEMVLTGLRYRPELREAAYRQRINKLEMNAALLRALPSVKGLLGFNHDSNDYLFEKNWVSASAKVSWNLLNVFRYPAEKRAIEAEANVLDQRDMALTMAVMTQVHVARLRFVRLSQELNTISRSQSVQERILALSRSGYKVKSISQQSLVREELNSVLSEVRYDTAYADLQNSYANLYASMGLDNFAIDITSDMSIGALTKALEDHWTERATTLPQFQEVQG